jgi:hypothetical protein
MRVSALLLIFALACACATAGKAAQVTLNEDGVLLIDGRKVLPIGFTGGPPPDGRTPEGKPAFEEIREAGGTFFRTGLQGGNSWKEDTIAQEQIWMDAAARYGLFAGRDWRSSPVSRRATAPRTCSCGPS